MNNTSEFFAHIILAHGAGAGKDSPFMADMAALIAARGVKVSLFNFAYMEKAIAAGKPRPPDAFPKLQRQFLAEIQQASARRDNLPLYIGGKSMGGRVASTILNSCDACGCICLGYPFHPPGKPQAPRIEHLLSLAKPLLIVQGERDVFGKQSEIATYGISQHLSLHFLADGDHSFKPRRTSNYSQSQHLQTAANALVTFIHHHVDKIMEK